MKVLMINSVCGIRSTGRICTDIADELMANGHECKIAYGREHVPEKYADIAVRIGTDWDVKLHGLKSRLLDRHGYGSKAATRKFIRWVKEYDPDVIHLHNIHGYYINIRVLFRYLKTCGKKIVWTFHDCWPFTGHCSYFSWSGCTQWKDCACTECHNTKAYPKSAFMNRAKRNFAEKEKLFTQIPNLTIVTPSAWLAGLVGESFLREIPVEVIHNGVDLSAFSPEAGGTALEKYGLQGKKIVLGVASTWDGRKGLRDFVKLSSLLPEEYRVVLVGLSQAQIEALPGNVTGIARTNNVQELAELYASAEVFCNPTYEDNFPTTNIEALACGTPVITYRTGGSPESLDETSGWVLEKRDVQGIADTILKIQDRAAFRKCCAERGLRFDKARMCRDYLEIYEK